jgi:hypothetical protein
MQTEECFIVVGIRVLLILSLYERNAGSIMDGDYSTNRDCLICEWWLGKRPTHLCLCFDLTKWGPTVKTAWLWVVTRTGGNDASCLMRYAADAAIADWIAQWSRGINESQSLYYRWWITKYFVLYFISRACQTRDFRWLSSTYSRDVF